VDISRSKPIGQEGEIGEADKFAYHPEVAAQVQASMWNELGPRVEESMGPTAAWTSAGLNRNSTLEWMGKHYSHVHTAVKPEEQ
jgi:hypothetical protein